MASGKRTASRIAGERRAVQAVDAAGSEVRVSRRARRWTQAYLGQRTGLSREYIARLESGKAVGAPLEVWFTLAEALGRPFRAEFARDGLAQAVHGAHLDIQELVLRLGTAAGYDRRFELATRPSDPARSSDAALISRHGRRIVLVECWNTFGDLGAAMRSSDRKLAEAGQLATASAGDGPPFTTGLCWVVRDTAAKRALIRRYEHIFASRFPASSAAWLRALTVPGAPIPDAPGLVWCDLRATRLVARRRPS